MPLADLTRFVEAWIEDWNHHRLEAILSHYSDDVTFISPKAAAITGVASIQGKDALRQYWSAAIARTTTRRFTLERSLWDPVATELVIIYHSAVDGRRVRAVELFRFGPDGLVVAGEALYGAELMPASDASSE
jgi:steroid delta-isomerase